MNEYVMQGLLLLLALFLVGLNALFVAAEFAFVRIRSTQVDRLVREGKATAGIVREATHGLDRYLAVSQLGITVSSLGLGALGEPAIATLIEPLLGPLGVPDAFISGIAFAIGFLIITFLHVVLGELTPKSVAIQKTEGTSLLVAPLMKLFYYLLLPGVVVFNGAANAIVRAFGMPPATETDETHTEDELRTLIRQSARQGILEEEEGEMVDAVFELNDRVAREVMVPRPDVDALPASANLEEIVSASIEGRHARHPVHEDGSPDRIIGMVHVRDALGAAKEHGSLEAGVRARDLMREVLIVPENKRISEILTEFRRQGTQMAVVIDEWGSLEGLVTAEDIVEEIVGEIRNEFDEQESGIQRLPEGGYSIDGRIPIQAVNRTLGTSFESRDFDTIGGLALSHLGRVPEVGDELHLDGYVLRVDETDGARVATVVLRRERDVESGGGEEDGMR